MRRKKTIPLLAMLTAGSLFILSGCSVDVTNINEEEVPIEVEVEEENLAEGTIMIHSLWYDANGGDLDSVEVAFYEDGDPVFSGTVSAAGSLETCVLPCNTVLTCSVTDGSGNLIAEAEIVIKLSEDYDVLTIYPTKDAESEEELPQSVVEVPIDDTNVRAAIFVSDTGAVSFASMTPYVEPEEVTEEVETEEVTEEVVEEAAEDNGVEVIEFEEFEEEPAEESAD